MYSIVYVLVDSLSQKYYKELACSILSLKKYMQNKQLIVVSDIETKAFLHSTDDDFSRVIVENASIVTAGFDNRYTEAEKSRFIKTKLREYIQGDYLFVDTDTLFCDELPELISEHELAMVLDQNTRIEDRIGHHIKNEMESTGMFCEIENQYYNSGVIWCKESPVTHEFYKKWHDMWQITRKTGTHVDQAPLYIVNSKCDCIKELSGLFNTQVSCIGEKFPIELISETLIIHYFNAGPQSSFYQMNHINLQEKICFDEELMKIIDNPRTAFVRFIPVRRDLYENGYPRVIESYQVRFAFLSFMKYKAIYKLNETIFKCIFRIYGRLIRIIRRNK